MISLVYSLSRSVPLNDCYEAKCRSSERSAVHWIMQWSADSSSSIEGVLDIIRVEKGRLLLDSSWHYLVIVRMGSFFISDPCLSTTDLPSW